MADKDLRTASPVGAAKNAAELQGITERAIKLMGDLGIDVNDSQNAGRLQSVTEALRSTSRATYFLTLRIARALCSDEGDRAMFDAMLATEAGEGGKDV